MDDDFAWIERELQDQRWREEDWLRGLEQMRDAYQGGQYNPQGTVRLDAPQDVHDAVADIAAAFGWPLEDAYTMMFLTGVQSYTYPDKRTRAAKAGLTSERVWRRVCDLKCKLVNRLDREWKQREAPNASALEWEEIKRERRGS